jgi:hypothetical protein
MEMSSLIYINAEEGLTDGKAQAQKAYDIWRDTIQTLETYKRGFADIRWCISM